MFLYTAVSSFKGLSVVGDNFGALGLIPFSHHIEKRLGRQAHHGGSRADGDDVALHDGSGGFRQFGQRDGAQGSGGAGGECRRESRIGQNDASGGDFGGAEAEGFLIECDQQFDVIGDRIQRPDADAQGVVGVAAADPG